MGMLFSIAVGVLAFALAPFFDAVGLYATPTRILLPVVGPLIPSSAVYRLFPDGGAPAGVFLILSCAFLFWTIVFGIAHVAWLSLRRSHN
jgi:hypothetical protein